VSMVVFNVFVWCVVDDVRVAGDCCGVAVVGVDVIVYDNGVCGVICVVAGIAVNVVNVVVRVAVFRSVWYVVVVAGGCVYFVVVYVVVCTCWCVCCCCCW